MIKNDLFVILFYIDNKLLLDDVALMHTALARNRMLQDLGNGIMHAVDDSLYR